MKWLTIGVLVLLAIIANAQSGSENVAINNDGSMPHPSAILDVSSENKGILIPRVPTSARQTIIDPADGLLVYDTDTNTFWFYSLGTWVEIPSSSSMSGPAAGDLSGNYPSPNVVKIQNQDVAPGVPFDKHVLKWDMVNNTWKGMKDSLSLPMNASFSNTGSLFGITNTNGASGNSALKGKMTTGSGITPSVSMGVWGDNSNGLGVVGTSNSGVGTYGLSFQNHGVYGYSTLEGFAGISGSHASDNGIGVLGTMSNDGIGILGRMTGAGGIAGLFESMDVSHADTTLKAITAGVGTLSSFEIAHPANPNPAISASTNGIGHALKVNTTNTSNASNAVDVETTGNTTGLDVHTLMGKAAVLTTSSPEAMNDAVQINNHGTRIGALIKNLNTTSAQPTVSIEHAGLGRSLFAYSSNPASTLAAGRIVSEGNRGLEVASAGQFGTISYAGGTGAIALHGTTGNDKDNTIGVKGQSSPNGNNGIGVLGEGGANDLNAIGVKGINYTDVETLGAVTGINNGNGVGVYGESTEANGIGILGLGGSGDVESKAALFKNIYSNNTKSVVDITSTGKGPNLFLQNTNLTNTTPLLHIQNAGTGNFLKLETSLGDTKTTISKEGNIATDGHLTVKEGKGIIRNSSANQLRFETLQTPVFYSDDEDDYELIHEFTLQFSEAYDEPPLVMVAGVNNYWGYDDFFLNLVVFDVTTTECKAYIVNPTSQNTGTIEVSWNLVVIGKD